MRLDIGACEGRRRRRLAVGGLRRLLTVLVPLSLLIVTPACAQQQDGQNPPRASGQDQSNAAVGQARDTPLQPAATQGADQGSEQDAGQGGPGPVPIFNLDDHISIVAIILRCKTFTGVVAPIDWVVLYGGLPVPTPQFKDNTSLLDLSADEMRLLAISRQISAERVTALISSVNYRSSYILWSVVVLILGSLTTLFAALSTMTATPHWIIKVLAVTFPILTTTATGYLTLQSPEAEYTAARRTANALGRLEGDMNVGLSAFACTEKHMQIAKADIDAFQKRLNDIHDAETSPQSSEKGKAGDSRPGGGGAGG